VAGVPAHDDRGIGAGGRTSRGSDGQQRGRAPDHRLGPAAAETKLDERTIARLQQVRQRLEQLGAEYVMAETKDDGQYRFHCRMLIDERSRFTRPFEASSADCIAAAEQVLRDVETWRLAASSPQAQLPR
jgi:hypothetical protein